MELWIKKIEENMKLYFDYIKVDPQYYFFSECVWFFIDKLLEIKKKLITVGNCRF